MSQGGGFFAAAPTAETAPGDTLAAGGAAGASSGGVNLAAEEPAAAAQQVAVPLQHVGEAPPAADERLSTMADALTDSPGTFWQSVGGRPDTPLALRGPLPPKRQRVMQGRRRIPPQQAAVPVGPSPGGSDELLQALSSGDEGIAGLSDDGAPVLRPGLPAGALATPASQPVTLEDSCLRCS
jgi:hypothetical protein